jgi:hypothetical protein
MNPTERTGTEESVRIPGVESRLAALRPPTAPVAPVTGSGRRRLVTIDAVEPVEGASLVLELDLARPRVGAPIGTYSVSFEGSAVGLARPVREIRLSCGTATLSSAAPATLAGAAQAGGLRRTGGAGSMVSEGPPPEPRNGA